MSSIKDRADLIKQAAAQMGKETYKGTAAKAQQPRTEYQKSSPKIATLEEAIRKCGLKDGMTISFHHHFRGPPSMNR